MFKNPIILVLFLMMSCHTEQTSKISEEKFIPKKQKNKQTVKKRKPIALKDSLNSKNVTAFFTAYGKQNKETIVTFSTRMGHFTVKLYKDTPIHRANFIFLAKKGYFDTTSFHRLVPGFVAQFGNSDKQSTVDFRNQYKQYKLNPEFRKNHKHYRGALAAARDWELNPNKLSTPFEFYIVQDKKGTHHLNFEHTVLGRVIKGMDVIDRIILEKTDKDEWPFIDIDLKVIRIE